MVQSLKNRIDDLKTNEENNKVVENENLEKEEDNLIKNNEDKKNEENQFVKEEKNEILTQKSHQSKSSLEKY